MKIYNEDLKEQELFFGLLQDKITKRKAFIEKKIEQIKHPSATYNLRTYKN